MSELWADVPLCPSEKRGHLRKSDPATGTSVLPTRPDVVRLSAQVRNVPHPESRESAVAALSTRCRPESTDPGGNYGAPAGSSRLPSCARIPSLRVTAVSSCPKSRQPVNEPKRCHDADPIGRDGPQPRFDDVRDSELLGQLHHAENGGDESKLSHLDADVEGEQRYRNVALRKTDIDQRAGEPEAVQKTE